MSEFQKLGLAAPLLRALAAEGYEMPTPIQSKAIPHVLAGRDLLGVAQTGTGKTAAFALPILQTLANLQAPTKSMAPKSPRACRALVLSPTRELASQIEASFRAYGRFLRLTSDVVFGGVPIGRQIRACAAGLDVVVATPGRLLDLIDQRALTLAHLEILVLDEADQMLDMGFIHAIRRIVGLLPKRRQSLFFSATMPAAIADLAGRLLTDPVEVAVTPVASTVERIDQSVIFCETRAKQPLLHKLLEDASIERALVFTRTKHGADRVVKNLAAAGIEAHAIHGNKSQPQREKALAAFRAGKARLLVATDIAARGIDVTGVSHVINFDLPNVPESYVHRIGRTARAGADGIAISFCDREERAYLRDIERLTRQRVPVRNNPLGPDFVVPAQEPRGPQPQRGGPERPQHGQGARGSDHRHGEAKLPHGQQGNRPQTHGQGRTQQRRRTSGNDRASTPRWA